ncbi:MAG TPA: DUF308 domain-containing protein [Actinospica sp.]|nr:DUF308 domain-containing protein [Actinospica sp.]
MSDPLEGEVVEPGGAGGGERASRGGGRPGGHPRIPGGLEAGRWRRMWLLPMVFGSAGVALGVLMLIWPGHTVKALTYLFGVYLLITGIYRFIAAVQLRGVDAVARVVALVLAVLSVGFGVLCLARPFHAAASLALVVGAFWLASGALSVFGARQRARNAPGRSPSMAGGVVAMIVGLLILAFPGASLVVLAWVLGLWLIFFGFSALSAGLVARRVLERARSAALYWP